MKWIVLPVGKFIEAKRLAGCTYDAVVDLYANALPEDPEAALAEAQGMWSRFLEMAVEPGGLDASALMVSEMTLEQILEVTRSFFLHQAGKAQKPSA